VGRKKDYWILPRRQMPRNTLITDRATKTKEVGGAGAGCVCVLFFWGAWDHMCFYFLATIDL